MALFGPAERGIPEHSEMVSCRGLLQRRADDLGGQHTNRMFPIHTYTFLCVFCASQKASVAIPAFCWLPSVRVNTYGKSCFFMVNIWDKVIPFQLHLSMCFVSMYYVASIYHNTDKTKTFMWIYVYIIFVSVGYVVAMLILEGFTCSLYIIDTHLSGYFWLVFLYWPFKYSAIKHKNIKKKPLLPPIDHTGTLT